MLCTLLRKHAEWAPVVPKLLASQTPRWTEKALNTHDIAIPLPRTGDERTYIRMVLLTVSDMKSQDKGWKRIERLYHLYGGHNVAMVLLLAGEDTREDGVHAYMELQARLLSSAMEMPIIPLSGIDSLPIELFAYQQQMLQSHSLPMVVDPTAVMLPYCTEKPPLPEQARNVLGDMFHNFRDLAMAATTCDGQQEIRKWLCDPTPEQAEGVIAFWLQEYLID